MSSESIFRGCPNAVAERTIKPVVGDFYFLLLDENGIAATSVGTDSRWCFFRAKEVMRSFGNLLI